jgi:hypothetical protein
LVQPGQWVSVVTAGINPKTAERVYPIGVGKTSADATCAECVASLAGARNGRPRASNATFHVLAACFPAKGRVQRRQNEIAAASSAISQRARRVSDSAPSSAAPQICRLRPAFNFVSLRPSWER